MKFRDIIAAGAAAGIVLGSAGIALAAPTGGSGGAFTDRADKQSFSANGITSTYQIFAEGLDTSKEVGMLYWTDGSGGYGIDNPNLTYLTDADGAAGMRQVARDNNMVLLIPEAPAPGCDNADNCWYNESTSPTAAQKADWARALINKVYSEYNIETDRVAIGGYSSGAQHTTRWLLPRHGAAIQTDGVFVPVAYGGAPASSAGTPNFPQAYKDAVVGVWNTGTSDSAYSTSSWGAVGGYNWYTNAGFTTEGHWPSGVGHSRGGEFDDIMRDAINRHVRAAQPVGSTTPTEPTDPVTTEYATMVNPTENGVIFSVADVPADAPSTYVRVRKVADGTEKYLYTSATGDITLTFQTLGTAGEDYTYRVFAGSSTTTTPKAEGSFRTWSSTSTTAAPVADYWYDPVRGHAPLTVQFTDKSTGAESYLWDFGDGTTSTEASPAHTFTEPGEYAVRLTVTNSAGSDDIVGPVYATVPGDRNGDYLVNFADVQDLSASRPDDTELAEIVNNWTP